MTNRESRLYLTLPLILSVNKAIESAPTALNLAWPGLGDTCRHLLNSADLLSLLSLDMQPTGGWRIHDLFLFVTELGTA